MPSRSLASRPLLAFAAVALAAGTAAAQLPPSFLVGGAVMPWAPAESWIVQANVCGEPGIYCSPFAAPASETLGGMAYDPTSRVYWHTNGTTLASVLADFGACDMECLGPSPVANASGLAFDARTQSVWILGSGGELARTAITSGRCPTVQSSCSLAALMAPGAVMSGLAVSEKHDVLFVSMSSAGAAPVNVVFVTSVANPCTPFCAIDLGTPFGAQQASPITGLGFDDGNDELFVAAGTGMARVRLSFPGCTIVSRSTCATAAGGTRFTGLCVQPPAVRHLGRMCESAPCTRCGNLRIGANDATIGNRGFSLFAVYGQTGSIVVPVASLGPCSSGVPFLCGNLHVSQAAAIVFPLTVLQGQSTCTGVTGWPMPIPADGNLVGFQFCFQVGLLCPTGGTVLSSALEVRVHGA